MSDVPIDPLAYLHGVKVVDIGDLRVARGKARRVFSRCPHLQLSYDQEERRVWCRDCETTVEPFDAFMGLVEWYDKALKHLERRHHEVKEAEAHALVSRAAKAMDMVWRSQRRVPLCPHCSAAILPEDVAAGVAECSKELIVRRRAKEKEKGCGHGD